MPGFTKPTTTQVPDALFDYWQTRLSGAELRVLLYASRRIFGFGKDDDDISLEQFLHGITTREGEILDEGIGLSRSTLLIAIKKLTDKGLLIKTRQSHPQRGDAVSNFRLNVVNHHRPRATSGLRKVNTTQVPDEIFDYWLPRLSDNELFVLLYVTRRTLGFAKASDIISPHQFLRGITTRDGVALDEGCGVSARRLYDALRGLVAKGLISIERRIDPRRGNLPSRYSLVFEDELPDIIAVSDPRLRSDPTENDVLDGGLIPAAAAEEAGHGGERERSRQRGGSTLAGRGDDNGREGERPWRQGGTTGAVGEDDGDGEGERRWPEGYRTPSAPQEAVVNKKTARQETGNQQQETGNQQTERQDGDDSKPSSDTTTGGYSADYRRDSHDGLELAPGPRMFSAFIDKIIRDITREFHDEDSLRSNRTQAYTLWHTSNLGEQDFANLLYVARDITRERRIEKPATNASMSGLRNKMPYFFAVVRRELEEIGVDLPEPGHQ